MSFLAQALLFLGSALIAVPICRRLGLSVILGYLAAGLVIGPAGLALFKETAAILHFAEIGVVFLLFIIGLELHPKRLWVMRRFVFGLGAAQVGITTIVIAGLVGYLFDLSMQVALLLGFALALSSTAFVLQLLGEQKKLNQPHGRAAFGVLLFQDAAVIPAIAVVSILAAGGTDASGYLDYGLPVAAVAAGLVAAHFLLKPALRLIAATGVHELFTAAALAMVVGAALAMQAVGLSMGLGAFLAGMMVADSEYRHQLEADIMPFKGLLLGLFFIAVGMSVDIGLLFTMPVVVLGLALALVLLKAVLLFPLARWRGLHNVEAIRTAIVLSQGGEFAFVLIAIGEAGGIVDTATTSVAILVVTISMVTTPFLINLAERFIAPPGPAKHISYDEMDEPVRPVLIAGLGRFGQIIARVLTMRKIPFTALDKDPGQVEFLRTFGHEIFYGDATRLNLMQNAGAANAKVVVVAVDDIDASVAIASLVLEHFPQASLVARARNRHHELRLRELGVEILIRDTLLSSLAMSEAILTRLGVDADEAARSLQAFREFDTKTIEQQSAVFHDDVAYHQSRQDAARELQELFEGDAEADA
ncbi:MAG: monovalent cation:proton antiporter-2 (CPA2) family protein [Gammaproteobacteria bacterium]|nr:monovalent cation:proton antiporter-2 (CPA2) family protein [Gammaproteobacteria bacterium]